MKRLFFFLAVTIMLISLFHHSEAANRALKLDGDPDSALEAPDHPSFDTDLSKLTVEAWVNPDVSEGEHMIVNKEDVYEIGIVDGIFKTAIRTVDKGWDWISSDANVNTGTWTHVAITYDEEKTRTYVNGKFQTESSDWQGKLYDSPDTFKVGRRTRGGDTHSAYIGLIDEVRISNTIRYDGDFDVPDQAFQPDDNTVVLYHFNEEVGGKVTDFSNYQHHGELVNKATLVDINLPNTVPAAIQPSMMLSIVWGRIKVEN